MNAWQLLESELDRWAEAGLRATCWWRDDDAVMPTPALERLLALTAEFNIPLALAVIPAQATDALARRLGDAALVDVCVHGWRHLDHAPTGSKKAEFGTHRPLDIMLAEAAAGLERLRGMPRLVPIFVPPWNRISGELVGRLSAVGYAGVSTFGARPTIQPSSALNQVNTHADLIDWRGTRGFAGSNQVLAQLVTHLSDRRSRKADIDEPTGLLSHHLVHDDACWDFLGNLFAKLTRHPVTRFVRPQAWHIADFAGRIGS